jgi:hypothetical protein
MKNDEFKEQIIDLAMNIVFIFNLQMNNNCNNAKFGMQRSLDDMLSISTKSIAVFAQSLELWAQLVEKLA